MPGAVDVTDRLHAHFVRAIGVLSEHCGEAGLRTSGDGIQVAATGRGPDEFNMALVWKRPDDPDKAVAWAREALVGRSRSQMIQVPADLHEHLAGALQACGAVPTEIVTGMVLVLPSTPPAVVPALRIERVVSHQDLQACGVAMARGFGAPEPELGRNLFPASVIDDPHVAFFNGYVSEREGPVATAFGIVVEGVAGVYGVTVHPDLRQTGLGTAMTWAAVQFGASAGADVAALQASAMGKPVYEAMGFQTVLNYLRFALL